MRSTEAWPGSLQVFLTTLQANTTITLKDVKDWLEMPGSFPLQELPPGTSSPKATALPPLKISFKKVISSLALTSMNFFLIAGSTPAGVATTALKTQVMSEAPAGPFPGLTLEVQAVILPVE